MSEHDRRYVSHYFNLPSVGVACGFTRRRYDFLRLDGQRKGSRGYHDRDVGTCRFFNEVDPVRHSQCAAAVCPAQLTPDGGSLSLVVAKLPHAAYEYDESLQRTHTRVRKLDGHDSCCVAGTFQQL